MSWWSRLQNVFRAESLDRDIDEEMQSHFEEALESGRDPEEVRRSFGSTLLQRERAQDISLLPALDALRRDVIFAWRQLMKRKVFTLAAVLSLGVAIGACTAAFRLIDGVLLRALPVEKPEQLYALARQGTGVDGKVQEFDGWAYQDFVLMRKAVEAQADLLAVSNAERRDVTYKANGETEKAWLQYVSGGMFESFGIRPAVGRLLSSRDDNHAGGHPYAVLSYDYWVRRFGHDRSIVGQTLRLGTAGFFVSASDRDQLFEIVGVAQGPFTGTEPGIVTDIFLPATMHAGATRDDWTWHRTLARVRPHVALEPLRAKLNATSYAFEENRARGFTNMSKENIAKFLAQKVVLESAAGGISSLQSGYRRALVIFAILVTLVLAIACANVANLMTGQGAARAREFALRVSIGAGPSRLFQMVMIESLVLTWLSCLVGGAFALLTTPLLVGMLNSPDHPIRLILPTDWRVFAFGVAMVIAVTALLGAAPAYQAAAMQPASVLKGGLNPRSRGRLMYTLVAVQVAFSFVVLFAAGLFIATFDRISHRPLGFSADRLLTVEAVARRAETPAIWEQAADQLHSVPGVESVAMARWQLLGGSSWNGFISVNGAPPGPVLAYFLDVTPGWLNTMKINLLAGRDIRRTDTAPGTAIVNETFARQYFGRERALGQKFARGESTFEVVGVVRDAPYRDIHEPMLPVAYIPVHSVDAAGNEQPIRNETFVIKTIAQHPLSIAADLRRSLLKTRPNFRITNIHTQAELIQAQTVRERLLSTLGGFFAGVALLLTGMGLYGVINHLVLQQQREIGIRIAIGASSARIAALVTTRLFLVALAGAIAGLSLGLVSARSFGSLLFGVGSTEQVFVLIPSLVIGVVTVAAALPGTLRALRIDPVALLRTE